jgi:DNA-binding NarL/FixJ family response regulator
MSELINQERDLLVIGCEETKTKALATIKRLAPDLAVVDISLKDSDGIDLVQEINRRHPRLPVLVLSMYDESLYAERALMVGARGYIMKQEAIGLVVKAIRHVLGGDIYASDKVKEKVFSRLVSQQERDQTSALDRLTNRELEVFRLIGDGLSTREIAAQMHVSIKTIGTYRENIKIKLGIKHHAELIKYAVHWAKNSQHDRL